MYKNIVQKKYYKFKNYFSSLVFLLLSLLLSGIKDIFAILMLFIIEM